MSPEPFAMGIPAAAAYLGIHRKVLDDAIHREQLPAVRIGPKGGRWSITTDDLVAWHRGLPRDVRDIPA